jgi:1-acyl-sn-glycerol-3-phosphate acyltransferase
MPVPQNVATLFQSLRRMTLQQRKYFFFRTRMMLLYPMGVLAMAYIKWLAPAFGRDHVERIRRAVPRLLSTAVLKLNGIRLKVDGLHNLGNDVSGARVLVTNHNSRFDGYILLAMCPFAFKSFWSDTAHITTEGFRMVAAFGRVFDLFFVHDKSSIRNTLREFKKAEQCLRDGGTVSFFPEGQFSRDGWVREVGASCIGLAVRTGSSVVPIVMLDTHATFESRKRFFGGTKEVRVVVLPPIDVASRLKADVPSLVLQVESLMNTTLAQGRQVPCPLASLPVVHVGGEVA